MALLPIRRRNPVDYAAREAAGEQFTEGQKRDAILSGGIVPEHWVAEIAGTLGIDLPGPKPIPTEDEFVLAVLKMFGGRLNPALVRDVYHQLAETERFGGR